MTRDTVRAKGAQNPKVTNYDKYFGTPERVAHILEDRSICDMCSKAGKSDCKNAEDCVENITEWLNQGAEE